MEASTAAESFCELSSGIRLCYRVDPATGDPTKSAAEADTRAPLLMIMGLGQQLISWPAEFIAGLTGRGLTLIRFDNRDSGRSSRVQIKPPTVVQQLIRRFNADQYTLKDMAADTVGLLDQLELESVNVAGVSMGGMIAQTLAAGYPDRVRSLTSIMSNTGSLRQGYAAPSTLLRMARPPVRERNAAIERTIQTVRHIGSSGFDFDAPAARAVAEAMWDRAGGDNPAGIARQIGAIYKSGDRTKDLHRITAPTLVIHGDRDPMVHPSGGAATAAAIPGARLVTIPGMGHDLPRGAWSQLLDLIVGNAR
jgi:pimeloyl-ACP methyl ester carboxylesterase